MARAGHYVHNLGGSVVTSAGRLYCSTRQPPPVTVPVPGFDPGAGLFVGGGLLVRGGLLTGGGLPALLVGCTTPDPPL
jgi:hypothetical protein